MSRKRLVEIEKIEKPKKDLTDLEKSANVARNDVFQYANRKIHKKSFLEKNAEAALNKVWTNSDMPMTFRTLGQGDVNFLASSWKKSYAVSPQVQLVPPPLYFDRQNELIARILENANAIVACAPSAPEDIYGYIVFEIKDNCYVFHYAYVKHTFRDLNVFSSLLLSTGWQPGTPSFYTHMTPMSVRMSILMNAIYNPYILIGV